MTEPPMPPARRSFEVACAILLFLGVWAVYWPACNFGFVNYDDSDYVAGNSFVKAGFHWWTVRWAFTTMHAANWHPLTWLSHMLDCQVFGDHPGAHHATNILLHAANAVLVFLLLRRWTGAIGWSFLAAALFAWHPLRVESVAWISERKDVLSCFFGFLALLAYTNFARHRRGLWISLLCFALSLLSKPMWVTMPFLLLLLDYWPLNRTTDRPKKLLLEKIPFFLLSAASCVVTFIAQHSGGSVVGLDVYPFSQRLPNALVSYVRYLGLIIWPHGLAVLQPYHGMWPAWSIGGAVVFLLAVSVAAVWACRRAPWFGVGWFWYLGTLVPVIGLVQVGNQSIADRYTYLPAVGLMLIFAQGLRIVSASRPRVRVGAALAGGAVAAVCLWLTSLQVGYWQDSAHLFAHAADVTQGSYIAYDNLGQAYASLSETKKAVACFERSLNLWPGDPLANYNLAILQMEQGRLSEAEDHVRVTIADNAKHYLGYLALGRLRQLQKQNDASIAAFQHALQLHPDLPDAHYRLGNDFIAQHDLPDAEAEYRQSLAQDPDQAPAEYQLGLVLYMQGRPAEAIPHYRDALRLKPRWIEALNNLAWILATSPDSACRDGREAVDLAQRALAISNSPVADDTLAAAYAECGQFAKATEVAARAARNARLGPDKSLTTQIEQHLELYRHSQPVRDTLK